MKTRNVIQAFQETLMDLPIADREERLQLFTEKLDALEDAQARRPADSGLDLLQMPLAVPPFPHTAIDLLMGKGPQKITFQVLMA